MKLIGLIVASIFAVAAFFLALQILGDDGKGKTILVSSDKPDVETVSVLVAAKKIDLGDVIEKSMVDAKDWPKNLVVDGLITSGGGQDSRDVLGYVSRSTFMPGEPISMNRLSNPEDPSFIAANLPEGKRMATISSDAIAGLAGFAAPGDRVDVVVTRDVKYPTEVAEEKGEDKTSVTETLISNIKVLAVNQRATIKDNAEIKNPRDRLPSSISLEVTLEEAQKLRLAQESGYVSLVMRSLKDKDSVTEPVVTLLNDITATEENAEFTKKEVKEVINLIRGSQKTEIEIPVEQETVTHQE